jgi:hypothetical protein
MREAALAVLVACLGCERSQAPAGDASPAPGKESPNASSRRPAPAPPPGDAGPHNPRWGALAGAAAHLPCRAVSVDADVRAQDLPASGIAHKDRSADGDAGGAPLVLRGEIPQDAWLALGPHARLVAEDPRTTRETTFLGPGRARACVGRREESWVTAGTFESVVGAGETPGAEEWVVTPFSVVRYGAAKVQIDAKAKETTVTLASGVVFLWLPDDARVKRVTSVPADASAPSTSSEGWDRLNEGTRTLESSATRPALESARSSVDRCTLLADRSHDLATLLMAPSVGMPDASTVSEQVTTRREARAACALAALRVGSLPASSAEESLAGRLHDAVAAWTALPAPPGAP